MDKPSTPKYTTEMALRDMKKQHEEEINKYKRNVTDLVLSISLHQQEIDKLNKRLKEQKEAIREWLFFSGNTNNRSIKEFDKMEFKCQKE